MKQVIIKALFVSSPSLHFPFIPFQSLPFSFIQFPSLPFSSLPFPSLPIHSIPSLRSLPLQKFYNCYYRNFLSQHPRHARSKTCCHCILRQLLVQQLDSFCVRWQFYLHQYVSGKSGSITLCHQSKRLYSYKVEHRVQLMIIKME